MRSKRGYNHAVLAEMVSTGQARALRTAAGDTIASAAVKLGVSYSTLAFWELGKRVPASTTGRRYVGYLTDINNRIGTDGHGDMASRAGEDLAGGGLAGATASQQLDGDGAGEAHSPREDRAGSASARQRGAHLAPDSKGAGG